jgi:CRISPR-associated endoribonuclease Cas6
MPAAAVLFLKAQQDGALYGATGQHAHGFWLTSWRDIAAEVGDDLHDDRPLRQFTVSPLLGLAHARRGRTPVRAGDIARLRLTALDDATTTALLGRWLLRLPAELEMGGLPWRLDRFALTPAEHPGAGHAGYDALRDAGNPAPRQWTLAFESPMAFHLQDERFLPFPLPERLVDGWLERWLEYAPTPLLPAGETRSTFMRRVEPGLRLSRYRLKTVSFRFRFDSEVPQIGCVGEAVLDAAPLDPADRAVVAALVAFAFYCGTGHHTTMGMGQTRPGPV